MKTLNNARCCKFCNANVICATLLLGKARLWNESENLPDELVVTGLGEKVCCLIL